MDEHLRKAYARLRAAAQRVRSANAELDAAEREHRVALELVELLEAKGTHSAEGNQK